MKKNLEENKRTADSEKRTKANFYLNRFFGKLDERNSEKFARIGKNVLFILLVLTEVLVLVQYLESALDSDKWTGLFVLCGAAVALTVSEALKLYVVKTFQGKIVCYILDFLAALVMVVITGSTYLATLYMIVLTEFYITRDKLLPSVVGCVVCMVVYVATCAVTAFIVQDQSVFAAVTRAMNDLVLLFVHFAIVATATKFYKQYLRLTKTMKELDESKAQLQSAYDSLAEMTALEERQRIAKDIHDTAGHSITTVIMQTEAAKLIIDADPEGAKKKIIAANLQAKHALEELRDSVHLLSGSVAKGTLKEVLISIINESTDGTDIKIRSDIDDVDVSDAMFRLICNSLKEGISNGLRHGGATAFWFELKKEAGLLKFLLSDNGSGGSLFDLKKGLGLKGMEERATRLGGKVFFRAEADEGFEIRIELPVHSAETTK